MNSKRNIYLEMKSLEEAIEILFKKFPYKNAFSGEAIPVPDSVGRVLAEPVTAKISSPNFHAAAMDGIAVDAKQTFGASEISPKKLVSGKDAFYINTGHQLPPGTNAVIMIEHLNILEDSKTIKSNTIKKNTIESVIEIEAPAFPWQHVRKMGEDIVATQLLFTRNHLITPYCIGALLNGGIFEVSVRRKPKVLIIPTGSELVDWRKTSLQDIKAGQVIESNSFVLGSLAIKCGAEFKRHKMIMDNPEKIKDAVSNAVDADYDIVLIIGGSSAGSEDYAKFVISSLGKVYLHGVTMMPGKPVLFGAVKNKPVFGIPGYPVSAITAFEQLVQPLLLKMIGLPDFQRQNIKVAPVRKIASKLGIEEFLRVKLGVVGNKTVATLLPRGSGSITTLTEADGIIRIPKHIEGIKDNEIVKAELLRPISSIQNSIVIVGSHDNTLDLLSDNIKTTHNKITISSSHVGSMGGLMAIKKGVCHLSGSHLLDVENGLYNISYIKKYLPDTPVRVVNLVLRDQGFIVKLRNPKKIKGIEDLQREDISFINRQSGSGTRVLLDYKLNQLGINPETVTGYENEEYTHMSVAVAVLSGTADVGLGIYAAAKALGLDFIPIVTEQYDLIIPEIYFESEKIQILLETIRSDIFKKGVVKLGGYGTEKTGELIF